MRVLYSGSLKTENTIIFCIIFQHYLNLLNQGRLLKQNEFYAMDTARRRRQLMRIFLFDKLVLITAVYRKVSSKFTLTPSTSTSTYVRQINSS